MQRVQSFAVVALLCAMLAVTAGKSQEAKGATATAPQKALNLLANDKHPEVAHIEIKGENPELVYIPIVHDNPEHRHAAKGTEDIEKTLVSCQTIAEHLYDNYGVRRILLEGLSKTLSDKYNSPEYRGRKLSVGKSKMVIFKVWFDLLNKNQWYLVPAYEKKSSGPLTLLGAEYNRRIMEALASAKGNGWFRSRQSFADNKVEFTNQMAEACKGYNDRLDALLREDPGLKREYDITVTRRNKVFIDNTLAAKGPGIIMCGGGHIQDLIDQFDQRKLSYMVIVPKGIQWPPVKKDDETIYKDMLKLGCQLKSCSLKFGDGTSAQVSMPIK